MRRVQRSSAATLLAALLLVVLAACGNDDGPAAPGDVETGPGEKGRDDRGWQLVEIVSATAVGGTVSETPSPIGTRQELRAFTAQFTRPDMRREIRRVRKSHDVGSGGSLVAAVVWIGCETPSGVTYEDGIVAVSPVPKETVQCLAPVTSVAVLDVEEEVSGAG